jgi:hypothetical protein
MVGAYTEKLYARPEHACVGVVCVEWGQRRAAVVVVRGRGRHVPHTCVLLRPTCSTAEAAKVTHLLAYWGCCCCSSSALMAAAGRSSVRSALAAVSLSVPRPGKRQVALAQLLPCQHYDVVGLLCSIMTVLAASH